MKDMVPGKAVEIGSDGNIYFALMNLENRYMMNFLETIGVKTRQAVITEVSDKWVKVKFFSGCYITKMYVVMQYDISRVVIVTEAPQDS